MYALRPSKDIKERASALFFHWVFRVLESKSVLGFFWGRPQAILIFKKIFS